MSRHKQSMAIVPAATFSISMLLLGSLAGVASAGPTPEAKCEAGTNDNAGKYAACLAKAEKSFVTSNDAAKRAVAVDNCDAKASNKWSKLVEAAAAKGAVCPADGAMEPIEDFIDVCMEAVADALSGSPLIQDPVSCQSDLDACELAGSACEDDLAACEAEPRGNVLVSGQTTCWDSVGSVIPCAGTGYDGELQEGVPLDYSDNGDGTIKDNRTGLVWEVLTDDGSTHDWNNIYTWADAFVKIDDLNTAVFAGHSDWRLPNIRELQSLSDFERSSPAIDPAFHTGCVGGCSAPACSCASSGFHWTSTTSLAGTMNAMQISFGLGVTLPSVKTSTAAVRAVRAGT